MPGHRRFDWQERIKDVEREFTAARKAVDDLLRSLERGTATLPTDTKVRDVHRMSDNLEGTYLIRLFAAFESGLRSYWSTVKDTTPPSRDLIEAIAARQDVPDDWREAVHKVRGYRNSLVHEGEDSPEPVGLTAARGHLQRFFSRLPERW